MTVRSAWQLNPGQTRSDSRLAPIGTFAPLDATQTRAGVVPGGTPMLLTGSGMTGSLSIGRAIVQGTATQGAYPVVITAAEPITVANGHASLPRIDSVFLVAYDQLYDTSGQTLAAVVYVQGTAASTPLAPAAPATGTAYLRLWDIAVPAGASAGSPISWGTALTDRRTYTAAVGGITPDGAAVGAYPGQYRDGNGYIERYSGSAWESKVYLGAAGQVVIGSDVSLSRSGAGAMQVNGSLNATGAGGYLLARRTADSAAVTNNTTLAADSALTVNVAANAVYTVTGVLGFQASTTGDIKVQFVGPSGATFDWVATAQDSTGTSAVGTVITGRAAITDAQVFGGRGAGSTNTALINGLLVTSSTAGSFGVQWAQGASDGTGTLMKAASYLLLDRVV
ncbi:hypothetical protein [Kitasatospora viridis]|uniref:Uncharacterized protein n=1 Tax=Kitasatospora viridis TaxID=281105 RepID=A0A561UKN6_9ACTN|nr:hypothetical protein [Kitasatospora viridis]TWF99906.1 hypothetical protein FHX73_113766 [Kitasatospora viridis]